MLLCIARGNEAFSIHLHGIQVRSYLTRRGRQALHLKEGLDLPHFGLVGAVGHGLALGGQDTRSFPFCVLCLLQWSEFTECGHLKFHTFVLENELIIVRGAKNKTYVVTPDVHLIHPVSDWKQEFDAELLVCHVDVRNHLTT